MEYWVSLYSIPSKIKIIYGIKKHEETMKIDPKSLDLSTAAVCFYPIIPFFSPRRRIYEPEANIPSFHVAA